MKTLNSDKYSMFAFATLPILKSRFLTVTYCWYFLQKVKRVVCSEGGGGGYSDVANRFGLGSIKWYGWVIILSGILVSLWY